MSEAKNDTAPVRTRLEMRQAATLKNLQKRKATAEAYIKTHTEKLEERLAPYRSELVIIDRMIAEHTAANPQLGLDAAHASAAAGTQTEE